MNRQQVKRGRERRVMASPTYTPRAGSLQLPDRRRLGDRRARMWPAGRMYER